MPIQLLPEQVSSQIAAGEVVERPASVVKELVENALDAGASQISVSVLNGGQKLIEVTDNGKGIPAEELELALTRHATSKLSKAEELNHIASLGFRGEALAAIASVSRLTLISRVTTTETAAEIRAEGGKAEKIKAAAAPEGTQIRVEDLFYNVPARLKFLKSERSERNRIQNLLTRFALAYPQVRFSLEIDERNRVHTSGNGDRREVLATLYAPDLARRMIAVDADYEDLKISGFISPTDVTRSNRVALNFFINGRWVQDPALSAAVVQAYRGLLMVGRFPLAALFIELPTQNVDVNVHPTKAEVRFLDADQVFSGLQRAVRRALLAHTPVPNLEPGLRWQPAEAIVDPVFEESQQEELNLPAEEGSSAPRIQQAPLPGSEVPLLRLVGQVGTAYLVAEGPDGLYLVDQHAAHERVLYERFQSQRQKIESQRLLEPLTIELSAAQAELLEAEIDTLEELGFEVEPFGPNTFVLRAMPALLLGSEPEAALRVLVEDFEEDESPLESEQDAKLIARVCKSAAVKAGQRLSLEEQEALLRDLEACAAPRTCPHGRPTMVHLSIDLLERQFGRRGAR
jgi:DNA mismatch repair protein MutL